MTILVVMIVFIQCDVLEDEDENPSPHPDDVYGDEGCKRIEGDDSFRCIRLPERSICARVEGDEDDFPDFILEVLGRCHNEDGIINEDQGGVPCSQDDVCQNFPGSNQECVFEIPAHLQGLCSANNFNPAVQNWSPQDAPAILGWNTQLPGHDRTRCYPWPATRGSVYPMIFVESPTKSSVQVPPCSNMCRRFKSGRWFTRRKMTAPSKHTCASSSNADPRRTIGMASMTNEIYRLEEAQCGDAGFCEYDSRLLLFEQPAGARENNFGFAEHCAQVCNDDGARVPIRCSCVPSMVGKTTGFS